MKDKSKLKEELYDGLLKLGYQHLPPTDRESEKDVKLYLKKDFLVVKLLTIDIVSIFSYHDDPWLKPITSAHKQGGDFKKWDDKFSHNFTGKIEDIHKYIYLVKEYLNMDDSGLKLKH